MFPESPEVNELPLPSEKTSLDTLPTVTPETFVTTQTPETGTRIPVDPTSNYSEWAVCKVEIHGFEQIPGADQVEIARFGDDYNTWDYPVVVRKGDFKEGDTAVYIPVDSIVPDDPEFSWVGNRRIRAKKIRGVYSEGLLISDSDAAALLLRRLPADDQALQESDRRADEMGYDRMENRLRDARVALQAVEPGTELPSLGITRYTKSAVDQLIQQGIKIKFVDTTFPVFGCGNVKKGHADSFLDPEERVVVTEKIHGSSIRFGFTKEGVLFLGTHRTRIVLATDGSYPYTENNQLRKAVALLWNGFILDQLREVNRDGSLNGTCFYGEIYGPMIQDLSYGKTNTPGFRIFGVYRDGKWEGFSTMALLAHSLHIDVPPLLADGAWKDISPILPTLAEGPTMFNGASHIREGVVVRATRAVEGQSPENFKYVGQAYRLRKHAEDNVFE